MVIKKVLYVPGWLKYYEIPYCTNVTFKFQILIVFTQCQTIKIWKKYFDFFCLSKIFVYYLTIYYFCKTSGLWTMAVFDYLDPLASITPRFTEEQLQDIVEWFDENSKPLLVINQEEEPTKVITIDQLEIYLGLRK